MFIKNTIEDYLRASNTREQKAHSGYDRKFYISDMNKCFRMRYLKRLGIQVRYDSLATLMNFRVGNFYHELGYEALRAKGVLLDSESYVSTEHFVGRFDGIVEDRDNNNTPTLFDFKSVHPYSFKKALAQAEDKGSIAQLLTYVMLKIKETPDFCNKGKLVSFNKLTDKNLKEILAENTYTLDTGMERQLTKEMTDLTTYWIENRIPECSCSGWQLGPEYNEFYLFCTMTELKVAEYVAMVKDGRQLVATASKILEVVDGKDVEVKI